jgi:oligopeptidase B
VTEQPAPPVARRTETLREHHGDVFVDHYEWLRERDDPDVRAHLDAENAYAEVRTAHLAPLRERIFGEIRGRVQETDLSVPVRSGDWWYYTRTVEGSAYAIHARSPVTEPALRPVLDGDAPIPGEQVILDGNVAAAGHDYFSLGALSVSADHRRVAYGVDVTGDERFDVTVADIATGVVLDSSVTGTGYGVEFSFDGEWIWHTRVDEAWRPHELWRHRIGTPGEDDVLVHREDDERYWMGVGASRDDRWVLLGLGSRTTSEVWLLDATTPEADFRCVAPRTEGVEYDVEPVGDRLLITHNRDRADFDLAVAPATATSAEDWVPVLVGGEGQRILGVDGFDDFAVVSLRTGALPALAILPKDPSAATGFGAPVPIRFDDEIHSVGIGDNPESATATIQVVHESFVSPRSVLDVDVATGERILLKQQPVRGGYDPAHYVQRREWVLADDGARIPLSIVHRAGIQPDGTNAALLTAYGAYEMSSDPYFSIARLSLLDRGVVYAVAHVRGGGELGRSWYEAARYERKARTFDDVLAAGHHLVGTGWAAPDRLGLEGGSAGGLLVGATVNREPGLFRVAHAQVPFVDPLTTILRPDLPLTVGEWEEWGNPLDSAEVYAAMKAYAPYENIAAADYPAILATTSLHDTRVYFTEAAKWVAALRATVTSDPVTRPILLRTEMAAGHGGRSGRYAAWEQVAWEWAFVLDQLGIDA